MASVKRCTTRIFGGRLFRRTMFARNCAAKLMSVASSVPMTVPGRSPLCIANSGSSSSCTWGSLRDMARAGELLFRRCSDRPAHRERRRRSTGLRCQPLLGFDSRACGLDTCRRIRRWLARRRRCNQAPGTTGVVDRRPAISRSCLRASEESELPDIRRARPFASNRNCRSMPRCGRREAGRRHPDRLFSRATGLAAFSRA